ncbi:hypothetical protein H6G80_13885 [Nostoc sp. FACHB-87]|nr:MULTISPECIES: hypothetical protein [Nostocaceae]MBD2455169.1 hypothetical protein [Nostoc sp. FACHB-87]MBD2474247.1 hypothetical protein [Anabaena sp. FACHB-83]
MVRLRSGQAHQPEVGDNLLLSTQHSALSTQDEIKGRCMPIIQMVRD